jgi:peptide/nickel transport system substrate-binding protein
MLRRSLLVSILAFWTLLPAGPTSAQSDKTLRVVMHSDLKILDPIWTTAYIVRNHGYLIYDTLFAFDDKLEPKPQMVESWTVSDDQLTWTFKLRDGLKWHDGQPVTTADVLPSIKRFTDKDALGGLLGKSTKEMTAVDERTFRIVLSEPFAMMLKALAKSASVPLFIMPKRVAETPVAQQISDTTGSGPYIFKKQEWKPGEKVVYVRNPDYKPRAEPPARPAGARPAACPGEGQERRDRRARYARPHLCAALQLEAATVQRRALSPRRGACAQSKGLPAGRHRRSTLLQGLQGDVRLRCATRNLGRHGGHAGVAFR